MEGDYNPVSSLYTQSTHHQLAKLPRTPRLTSSDVILAKIASDESAAMTNSTARSTKGETRANCAASRSIRIT